MRGADASAGNTAKNIALIVLAVLMAVLCAANWLARCFGGVARLGQSAGAGCMTACSAVRRL